MGVSLSEMEAYAAPISKEMMRIRSIMDRIHISLFGQRLQFRVAHDQKHTDDGRIFVQVIYRSPDSRSGEMKDWKGRKWYLSEYMTDDEIVKTCYAAFESAVKHEVMEGFKVDGKVLFNPHVNFEELLKITHLEVSRDNVQDI